MSSYAHRLWESLPSVEGVTQAATGAVAGASEVARDAVGAAADYGNQAAQQALLAGQGAVEAGRDLATGAVEAGTGAVGGVLQAGADLAGGAVDAGADLVGGALGAGAGLIGEAAGQLGFSWATEPDGGDLQAPEQVVDVPVQAEEPPAVQAPDLYKDQIDNESEHVGGSVSCSPTSFTMALIGLHGGDEASVRAQTITFLEELGGRTDYTQTEELVIELLQKTDWSAAYKSHPQFFWRGWLTTDKNVKAGRYYKDPYAQQYLASRYSGASLTGANFVNIEKASDWDQVADVLDAGGQATTEGDFTSSGHVVQIVEVDASGILINDPYGAWVTQGVYIRNGAEQVPGLGAADIEVFKTRASKNGALLDAYESFADPETAQIGFARWGERNYYTMAEATALKLGKWVSLLS